MVVHTYATGIATHRNKMGKFTQTKLIPFCGAEHFQNDILNNYAGYAGSPWLVADQCSACDVLFTVLRANIPPDRCTMHPFWLEKHYSLAALFYTYAVLGETPDRAQHTFGKLIEHNIWNTWYAAGTFSFLKNAIDFKTRPLHACKCCGSQMKGTERWQVPCVVCGCESTYIPPKVKGDHW